MTTDDDHSLPVDLDRSVTLEDVGLPGFGACVLLGVDGEEVLALIYAPVLGTPDNNPCQRMSWKATAPHELTGQLPRAFAPKCGHCASTSNKPCRNVVARYGEACPYHQQRVANPRTQREHA